MDFAQLQALTREVGFRVQWTALLRMANRYPEPVLDWVAAAGEYAAVHTGCDLLRTAVADQRDRIATTEPDQLYQYAEELSRACDLLTESQRDRDEARDRLSDRCRELASLDPNAIRTDPGGPEDDPPLPPKATVLFPAAAATHTCHLRPPGPRRRPRRRDSDR